MTATLLLGLSSTFLFGLRHGVDYDHIAAITDLTSVEQDRRRAFRLGMVYALGHALVITLLGMGAIAFGATLPASVDAVMERIVGATLILLGAYVLYSLLQVRPMNPIQHMGRIGLIKSLLGSRLGSSGHRSAFVIGMLHGVGAETPTQLGLFLFAAGMGGRFIGIAGLALFVVGLLITNAAMCLVATRSLHLRNVRWQRTLAGLSAAYSLGVGVTFLLA